MTLNVHNTTSVPCGDTSNIPAPYHIEYKVLIWVMPLLRKLTIHGKPVKVELIVYGPAGFHSGQSWVAIQTQLAELVDSSAILLVVKTIEWQWQKPANSLWAPL